MRWGRLSAGPLVLCPRCCRNALASIEADQADLFLVADQPGHFTSNIARQANEDI